jgi:hypothetical protein
MPRMKIKFSFIVLVGKWVGKKGVFWVKMGVNGGF